MFVSLQEGQHARCVFIHEFLSTIALAVQSLQKMIKNVEMKPEPLSYYVFKDTEDSTLQ